MLKKSSDIELFLKTVVGTPSSEIDLARHFIEIRLINPLYSTKCYFFAADSIDLEKSFTDIVAESQNSNSNVYVSIALRDSNKSGKNADCSLLRCFITDHDELNGVKLKNIEDPTKKATARQELLELLRSETHIPPTLIVDSGNGFHCYYCLDHFVDIRKHADTIKMKMQFLNGRYPQAPGDPAMMKISQPIRLPGSWNFKDINGVKPCKILEYHPERQYKFSDIPNSESKSATTILSKKGKTSKNTSFYPFWECKFLNWMRENPAEQTYHLWFAAASTLAFFGEEGREAFHELSSGYPKYSQPEINRLFDDMLKARSEGIGPITYEKITEYGFTEKDDTDAASPAIYIQHLYKNNQLKEMGITFKEERLLFNPNIFAEFFMKQEELAIYEGKIFYCYREGVWTRLEDYELLRKIRDLVQDTRKNIFNTNMGNNALEMLRLAVPPIRNLDGFKRLINVENGMLNLETLELLPHASSYYSSIRIPLTFDPKATCTHFEKFVQEIMDDDPERVCVIQEFFGYLLTADTVIHKAFFLFGEGSNGKSVLLDILTYLIGPENVSNLSLTDLDNSFRRANLVGKTANIATENEISSKGFNSQYFKAVVSGDRIQVERKYEAPVSYSPLCKLVFAVNNLPYSRDRSYGLYRRMLIIPFNRRFEGKNADKRLKLRLLAELPGILNWAITGLVRLQKNDYEFTHSSVITNAVKTYIEDQNPIHNFILEMISLSEVSGRVAKAHIMENYNLWCHRNGLGDTIKISPQKFWNTFRASCKELGVPFEQQTSNGIRYLKGLSVKEWEDPIPHSLSQLP